MSKYYAVVYSENSLSHHGIKGQKWGERRFQNEDGSLTQAGAARYNVGEAKRAFAETGLIGYAKYRRTHTGRAEAIVKYKKDKAAAKEAKRKAKIKAATDRDYAIAKKMGKVKNRKEYDAIMKAEDQKRQAKIDAKNAKKKQYDVNEAKEATAKYGLIGKAVYDSRHTGKKEAVAKYKKDKERNTKRKVAAYNRAYDKASRMQDDADAKWRDVQSQYKSLGKTRIGSMIQVGKAQRGHGSEAANKYLKDFETASKMTDAASKAWEESKRRRKQTGSTGISRTYNAIKYRDAR